MMRWSQESKATLVSLALHQRKKWSKSDNNKKNLTISDSGTCARVFSSSSCGDSAESYFQEFVYKGRRIVVSNQVRFHLCTSDGISGTSLWSDWWHLDRCRTIRTSTTKCSQIPTRLANDISISLSHCNLQRWVCNIATLQELLGISNRSNNCYPGIINAANRNGVDRNRRNRSSFLQRLVWS